MDPHIVPVAGIAEPFSSISHLVAAGLFASIGPRLVRRGTGGHRVALVVFVLCCATLFLASGTYHFLAIGSEARAVARRMDHAAIFMLIAGTFTAPHAILFKGAWRWGMILFIWALAAAGIVLKVFFFEHVSEAVGLSLYLGMGWIGLVSGSRVLRIYGPQLLIPLVAGGLAYTVGAVLEFLRWPVLAEGVLGPHELFHLAVVLGVACHWEFVHRFAHGEFPPRQRASSPAFEA